MVAKAARRISVIVPMYNEEKHVLELYQRLVLSLEPLCEWFEILCVDDGSDDNTFEILKRLHALDRRVRAFRFSRNFGKECAMTAGLDFCRGDLVVIIDADLQHPPECIGALVMRANEGFDVVYAVRRSRRGQGLVRRIASDVFHDLMHRVGSVQIVDGAGDFRVMRRKVVLALRQLRESQRYMKGLFAWAGFRTSTVAFDQVARDGGDSRWTFCALIGLAVEALTSFSAFPLRGIIYLGLAIAGITVIATGAACVHVLLAGSLGREWLVILFVLFMGGMQILCVGVVGEYVGRSYAESKRRPLYFIREALGGRRQLR